MRLIYNSFVAAAAVAFTASAAAQNVPPTTNSTTNGTMPGNMPDEPGTPAQTPPAGSTSPQPQSGQAPTQTEKVAPAAAADIKAGASVYDQSGALVGKIRSVSKDGAVVDTGTTRAQVPVSSLGKGDKGLVIGMTKSELDAAAKKKTSPPR